MSRKLVVRLQLLLLAVLVVLLVGRGLFDRITRDEGLVISQVDPYSMKQLSFVVDSPTQVEIGATGSLESLRSDARLAAYAWLVRRDDHHVVWRQSVDRSSSRDGTLVSDRAESMLSPGTYDLYFAAYGRDMSMGRRGAGFLHRLLTRRPDWERDHKRWRANVRAAGSPSVVLRQVEATGAGFEGAHVIWSAAPMGDRDSARQLFEVTEPIDVRIYSIGELQSNGKDYGWIDDLTRRTRVWELGADNSAEAGGHSANRKFDGHVRLQPGVYAAAFETDAGHAYPAWRAAPPYEPRLWGLTLLTEDSLAGLIRPFDPWQDREPLLELTRIGSSRHESVEFSIDRPMGLFVAALGEMRSSERYDFGWIEDESGRRVWEMRHEESGHAGGAERNRELQQFLSLESGRYTLHFRTDDSHAYGDWRSDTPRRPEQWGMTLFPVDPNAPGNRFRIVNRVAHGPREPDVPLPPEISHPPLPGHVLAHIVSVGNDRNESQPFEIDTPSSVTIRAQGELLPHERYDYAWIERAESGQTVWEMTWANTRPGGNDQRNRRFEGEVRLEPGHYVLRYKSDPSHALGDFGKIPPDDPAFWGVTISRLP